jgi:hypothetical protein
MLASRPLRTAYADTRGDVARTAAGAWSHVMANTTTNRIPPPNLARREYLWVLMAIAGLFLSLFGRALQAKFYVVEDHILVAGSSWGIPGWVARITADIQDYARLRPVYWMYYAIGSLAFGVNPHLWHAATILWGVLTCYLFYVALRTIGADIVSSFIFVLLLVLSGGQNWIWINLVPQETIGMLLTATAVWGIAVASQRSQPGRADVVTLTTMALAGLVKESFVLLIPALLLLRWTCQKCLNGQSWRESLHQLRVPLTVGALVFVIEITLVMVVLLSKPGGYSAEASGLSVASFAPTRWLRIVWPLTWYHQLVVAAGVFLWVSLWFDKTVSHTCLLASMGIFAAWSIPQVVLYTKGLNERYLFPAIVCVAAAIAWELSILWRRHLWPLWVVGVLLILPVVMSGVRSTTTTVGWFTAETLAANRVVEFVAQNVRADQTILMAGDAGTAYGFEATYSLPLYLKMAGSNSPFYLWPLVARGERSALHIAASKNNTAFRYPDSLTPHAVGAIIIVDTSVPALDAKALASWLADTRWREINFAEPYYGFSISEFKYVKAGEVNHKILLPAASGVPGKRSLIVVDPLLTAVVSVSPLLDAPPWPLEPDPAGPGSILWLGQGDAQGLGVDVSSTMERSVDIVLELVPGPGRPDSHRTIEFRLENRAGQSRQRKMYEGGQLRFNATLLPGGNRLRLAVLDEVLVRVQPNGDTRPLLALLRGVVVTTPSSAAPPKPR